MNYNDFKTGCIKTAAAEGYDQAFMEAFFKQAEYQYACYTQILSKAAEASGDPDFYKKAYAEYCAGISLTPGLEKLAASEWQDKIHNWLGEFGQSTGDAVGELTDTQQNGGAGLGGAITGGIGGLIIGLLLSQLFGIPLGAGMLLGALGGGALGYGAAGTMWGKQHIFGQPNNSITDSAGADVPADNVNGSQSAGADVPPDNAQNPRTPPANPAAAEQQNKAQQLAQSQHKSQYTTPHASNESNQQLTENRDSRLRKGFALNAARRSSNSIAVSAAGGPAAAAIHQLLSFHPDNPLSINPPSVLKPNLTPQQPGTNTAGNTPPPIVSPARKPGTLFGPPASSTPSAQPPGSTPPVVPPTKK